MMTASESLLKAYRKNKRISSRGTRQRTHTSADDTNESRNGGSSMIGSKQGIYQ
jgi:hypothetical protein